MGGKPRQSNYAYCLCIPADIRRFNEGVSSLSFVGVSDAITNVTLHSYAIVARNYTRSDRDCERLRCIGYGSTVGRGKAICRIVFVLVSDHRHRVSANIVSSTRFQGSHVSVGVSVGVFVHARNREGKE